MNRRLLYDLELITQNKCIYNPNIYDINSKTIYEKYKLVLHISKHTNLIVRIPIQYPLYPIKFYLEFNKNLYLVWYLCKSKNILDVFDIISQFYPTQFIEINYKYIFLQLGIKSTTDSSIIFEYDDLMSHSPLIHIDEYINRAIQIGYKYHILSHPIFYRLFNK